MSHVEKYNKIHFSPCEGCFFIKRKTKTDFSLVDILELLALSKAVGCEGQEKIISNQVVYSIASRIR